ncbi:hypothetical protein [Kitasatospora sp. NPDC058397]
MTAFCNERCDHCYADSGPDGTHGRMTELDWRSTIDVHSAVPRVFGRK